MVKPGNLTLGEVANPDGRYMTGYYPSWSDNWFTILNNDGSKKSDNDIYTASNFAKLPGVYTHVKMAFAQPNFAWAGLAANTWSGTGLNFNANPTDIKEVIRVMHQLKKKVILTLGGATYPNWSQLPLEAGQNGPTKSALTQFLIDMGVDGLDVDYELQSASMDDKAIGDYARTIQAMREAVSAAGPDKLLTLAAWSTGADYTATTGAGPNGISFWGDQAGRERLTFAKVVANGPFAGRTIVSLFDVVDLMTYDAQTLHFDPVTTYDEYRALVPASTPVSIGLEISPEGWSGGLLVINNSDASVPGTYIALDQYGRSNRGAYSVERFLNYVKNNTASANPHDGGMLWHVLNMTVQQAGSAQTANAATVATKAAAIFGYVPTAP